MTHHETPRVPPQRTSTGGCAMPLELLAVVLPGLSVAVRGCLRYHPAEPYTVYLDNHIDLDAPITWVFARDLLATGLTEWAGTGDVCVHPAGDDRTVFITLTGENSTAVLRVDASHIRTFLTHTERIVPSGTEEGQVDVDRFLRRLRDDEPPEPEPELDPGPDPEPKP